MFSFLKKSVSAADLAEMAWDSCGKWPEKYGADLKEQFAESFDKDISDVADEMVYYLGFATDYSFYCHLNKEPAAERAVRSAFGGHLGQYAREHNCKPIPEGNWMGEGLIWMPSDKMQPDNGNPLNNLKNRFDLYGKSMLRHENKSAAQQTAYLLAAWCGNPLDITFIAYASELFMGPPEAIQNILKSYRVKA